MNPVLHNAVDLVLSVPAQAPASIDQVIDNLKKWIIGILAAVASLFLVIGGLRYITAGGDPGQVEQAKANLRNALVGYALAVLAPLILAVLQGIVGSGS
ncbi:hypothetical protein HDA40_001908 [Hamadaea flava]|uniref:Pilin n=1 Tax=Hamadaea flava TaxID=1742688 RepID=A0ABV8LFG8_9ACTN|nr:pilin [Hamadaea flava]MCP2323401.1 hypothetical protein [Hamadaea flava]